MSMMPNSSSSKLGETSANSISACDLWLDDFGARDLMDPAL
jgi:hypothetical protein